MQACVAHRTHNTPQTERRNSLVDECPADECPTDECPADDCPTDECPADDEWWKESMKWGRMTVMLMIMTM